MLFGQVAAAAAVLPLLASAHMQMVTPFPINSAKDPAVPDGQKDYGYTSPLHADGSDFPCKGYHLQESSHVSKATYKAGGAGKLEIADNTAVHGGGSCQVSLSYDNGKTWKVIKSMIGGCPVTRSYDFTIPADAPSSKDILLAWTWFNLVGNREMYMNCARVTVEGSTPGRHRRAQIAGRDGGFSALPDMFACNLGKGCTTKENQNVIFPNPGGDVIKGENTANTNGGNGFEGVSAASGPGAGAGGGAGAPAAPPAAPPAPAAPVAPSSASPPFPNGTAGAGAGAGPAKPTGSNVVIPVPASSAPPKPPAASAAPAPAPAAPAPAAPAPAAGGSCTSGEIICNSATTWSMCANGKPVSMGSTAPGTTCSNGKIV